MHCRTHLCVEAFTPVKWKEVNRTTTENADASLFHFIPNNQIVIVECQNLSVLSFDNLSITVFSLLRYNKNIIVCALRAGVSSLCSKTWSFIGGCYCTVSIRVADAIFNCFHCHIILIHRFLSGFPAVATRRGPGEIARRLSRRSEALLLVPTSNSPPLSILSWLGC